MTAKDWLQRGWKLDQEINALEDAKRKAYDRCISATARPESVSGGTEGNLSSDGGMSAYANFAALIDKQIDRLVDTKREIASVIGQVDDAALRTLLTERYINFETWEQIAVSMNYSYQHVVQNLHPKALKRVDSILHMNGAIM